MFLKVWWKLIIIIVAVIIIIYLCFHIMMKIIKRKNVKKLLAGGFGAWTCFPKITKEIPNNLQQKAESYCLIWRSCLRKSKKIMATAFTLYIRFSWFEYHLVSRAKKNAFMAKITLKFFAFFQNSRLLFGLNFLK